MTSQTKLRRVALQNSATKGSRIKNFYGQMPFSLPHRCFSVIKNADNSNKYNQHTWAKFGV